MGSEGTSTLTAEILDALRELIRENLDSRDGLKGAAGQVIHRSVARFCRELSEDRAAQAGELQAFVARNGGDAKVIRPAAAVSYALWVEISPTLATADACAILSEIARCEEALRDAYDGALRRSSHVTVNDILQRHHAAVTAAHGRLHVLHDQHKKA